jgi:ribose transport system ATP-binding protein
MLHLSNIRKEFPGTLALDGVSLSFEDGSVHALLGKNGAGKSTLLKIISGAIPPTSGKININGKDLTFRSPSDAFRNGIASVYQELSILQDLTVGENILIGRLPKKKFFGQFFIDWKETFRQAEEVLSEIQVDIDVRKKASEIGVAQRQIVEIAKAMSFRPSVLLLDEPTSALAYHEVDNLFKIIKMLKAKGVAIVYITHRLNEVQQIADKISVLRDGKCVGTLSKSETTPVKIVNMMFGDIPERIKPEVPKIPETPILELKDFHKEGKFFNVNLKLFKGEILGIAGMLGSGRTELLRAIYGADEVDRGEIIFEGKHYSGLNPVDAKKLGIAFISEDRKDEGLVQILSTRINVCLASYNIISNRGVLTRKHEQKVVRKFIKELDIKVADAEQPVTSLSGGNQQKVIIAKWLNTKPRIILLDEPTRGIDIQTKQQIFQIVTELSSSGISIIFVSTELEELLEVCHRILIMKKGLVLKEILPKDITAEDLFVACMEN